MSEKNKNHNKAVTDKNSDKISPAKVTPKDVREEMSDIRKQISLFKQYDPETYKQALSEAKNYNVSIVDYLFDSPILKQYKKMLDERRQKKLANSKSKSDDDLDIVEVSVDQDDEKKPIENISHDITITAPVDNDNQSINVVDNQNKNQDDDALNKGSDTVSEESIISESEDAIIEDNINPENESDNTTEEVENQVVEDVKLEESDTEIEPANVNNKSDNQTESVSEIETIDQSQDSQQEPSEFDRDNNNETESDETFEDQSDTMFIQDEPIDKDDAKYKSKKVKKGLFKTEEYIVAPEKALPDDITEAEIAEEISNAEGKEPEQTEEDDDDNYEGMSEEEIAEAKERKRVLNELKQRYDAQGAKNISDLGDYKKNLDFSVNTGIKRFRLKPPKKPFIIAAVIITILLAISLVSAYFIVNQPPAPIYLASIKLSQNTTYQYVGEDVDLRGIKIKCIYSDNSEKYVDIAENMIYGKSENINEENNIVTYDTNTFVAFKYQGYTANLKILLYQPVCQSITVEIFDILKVNETISFNNILLLGKIVDEVSGETIGYKKIDPSILTLTVLTTDFEKSDEGFIVPDVSAGSYLLKISCEIDGTEYNFTISDVKIIL